MTPETQKLFLNLAYIKFPNPVNKGSRIGYIIVNNFPTNTDFNLFYFVEIQYNNDSSVCRALRRGSV